jgi:hypothetical protein
VLIDGREEGLSSSIGFSEIPSDEIFSGRFIEAIVSPPIGEEEEEEEDDDDDDGGGGGGGDDGDDVSGIAVSSSEDKFSWFL